MVCHMPFTIVFYYKNSCLFTELATFKNYLQCFYFIGLFTRLTPLQKNIASTGNNKKCHKITELQIGLDI